MNNKCLENTNLLLVEDSIDSSRIVKIFAEMAGAHIDCFEDAQGALDALKSETRQYDLVMSDLSLQNMDGYSFCSEAKKNSNYTDIPFIALSGHENIDGKSESHGFISHLQKPFDPNKLIKEIYNLTRQ